MGFPSLLVPVFRGGSFFQEAVVSIKPCLGWFSRCIISLNGAETSEDRSTAMQLSPLCELIILDTKRDLTSVQHGMFIVNQLISTLKLDMNSQIFTLCHDDMLSLTGFQALDLGDWCRLDPHSISLGDYLIFKDGEPASTVVHKTSFDQRSKERTRRRTQAYFLNMQNCGIDPFTNISGMRMTLAIMKSTLKYYRYTGARIGIRMEYSYISNRRIESIVNHNPPLVVIRTHPKSEGALISYKDFIPGELRYLCWLWLNCKSVHQLRGLCRGRYNFKTFLWLSRKTLEHRYYDFLGFLRSLLVRLGLIH